MTTLISTQSLQLEANTRLLFQDLTFTLKLGDRIGLIGHNGCGKSTLLNLLSGALEASSGAVQYSRQCQLKHVEQHLPAELADLSLYDALVSVIDDKPEMRWRVDSLLRELDINESTATVAVKSLSGGEHTRLLLGRAVLQNPNLLLLDEPSNHLDLPSLLWLEQFLNHWKGAFILVSHDQRLLDNVTHKSWILRDHRLYCFDQPCGLALQGLKAMDETAVARRASEQKEIDRLTVSSKRLAIWGKTFDSEDLSRKAKTIEKRIDKLKNEQSFVTQGEPWTLSLNGKSLAANQLLSFEKVAVHAAPSLPVLFYADQLWLKSGDKIALLGANGAGKSSLLRQCWSDISQEKTRGGFYYHLASKIGYYDQSLAQLPDQANLVDALYPYAASSDHTRTEEGRRRALISAGFAYTRHHQKVSTLSGGERARLLFLALSLASYNLLFLDEPTNHLDMKGKLELINALSHFEGGFLLVSHDRDLIEQSCTGFWVLHNSKLEKFLDAGSAYECLFSQANKQFNVHQSTQPHFMTENTEEASVLNAEQQLAKLYQLEKRLADDVARKPKHQKPKLQQQWRDEIVKLNKLLGLDK